jgi:hypothetical protein
MAKKSVATATPTDEKMTVTMATADLQAICNKVAKGVKNNKVMDITGLLLIKFANTNLTLTATDGTTNVECTLEKVASKANFEVLIKADTFIKLISRTTAPKITLTVIPGKTENDNNCVQVKGNGTYNFETEVLQEGDQFPNFKFDSKEKKSIKKTILDKAIKNNRPATSDNSTTQLVYTGIFFGDDVISSDSEKATATLSNIFGKDILLRAEAIDLLSIFDKEELTATFKDERIIITDGLNTVYTAEMENKNDYALDVIRNFIYEGEFSNEAILRKDDLLGCLDRLSIFKDAYSCDGVQLSFDKDGVTVTNTKSKNASETISYVEDVKDIKPFVCDIKADYLKSQIQVAGDFVCLGFGNDTALRIKSVEQQVKDGVVQGYVVEDNVILLVAFLEDEQ